MNNCSRSMINSLRALFAACLVLISIPKISEAGNVYQGGLVYARWWVPELPPPKNGISKENAEAFKILWSDVGRKGDELEEAWKQARKGNPLFSRALDGLARRDELTVKYNELRNQLRKQYGQKSFSEFERFHARWRDVSKAPWLDLNDTSLVRLILWFESLVKHNGNEMHEGQYDWLAKTSPYKDFVRDGENVTEDRAIQIYRDAFKRSRADGMAKVRELEKSRPISDLERSYMESHDDSDFLSAVCEPYFGRNRPEFLQKADSALMESIRAAAKVRPDLLDALKAAHQHHMAEMAKPVIPGR